jgi:hypothetical protein
LILAGQGDPLTTLRLQPSLVLAASLHAPSTLRTCARHLSCSHLLKRAALRYILDHSGTQLVHLLIDCRFNLGQCRFGVGLPPFSHGPSHVLALLLPLLLHLFWVHVLSCFPLLSRSPSSSYFTTFGSLQKNKSHPFCSILWQK